MQKIRILLLVKTREKPYMSTSEPHTRLKTARIADGYKTAASFCKAHQIPLTTYSMYEAGRRAISHKIAKKYAELLHTNTQWIMTGTGSPYPDHQNPEEILTEQEFFKLLNYSGNSKLPFIKSEAHPINSQLYCKIFEEIILVLSDYQCSLDIKYASQYATEIYQDILQSSEVYEEQLAMINLAMTILKRNLRNAGFNTHARIENQ